VKNQFLQFSIFVCTSFVLTEAISADAPGAVAQVSLRQATDAAWQKAISANEVAGMRLKAEAEKSIATNFWAAPPTLEFSQRSDRWNKATGLRENELGIAWPVLLPGRRDAAVGAADAELSAVDAAEAAYRHRIAGEVREAAWLIAELRAGVALAEQQLGYMKRLAADVSRRVAAGDLARADSLSAEAETLSAEVALLDARQQLGAAISRWKLLTGLDQIPDPSEPLSDLALSLASHPEAIFAAAADARSQNRVLATKLARLDAPELSLQVRDDFSGSGLPGQRSIGIGIRIPLGQSERGRTQFAAALSERNTAGAQLQLVRERLQLEAAVASAVLMSAEEKSVAERGRAKLLVERANLIEKSFNAGESSLQDLLRASATAASARASHAKLEVLTGLARARLNQANGKAP